ncbi:MAG: transposase [Nevskiaceae bacterium]
MPRRLRYELADVPQHVVQRGNNRQATFFGERDYCRYLEFLADAAQHNSCSIHAYALMPNHVHLLVTPHRPLAIARLMQSVGRRYVRFLNDACRRSGTLWEGRYKASLVASQRYLFNCYRYIELNPVRAGLTGHARDYRWSSHCRNALGLFNPLVTEHAEYTELAPGAVARAAAYRRLFDIELAPETVSDIRDSLNHCRAFGPDAFKASMSSLLKREIRQRKPGRPRKTKIPL